MRAKKILLVLIFLLTYGFYQMGISADKKNSVIASMLSVIAKPNEYNNQKVVVHGVVSVHPEESRLYFNKEFYEERIKENSVSISVKNPTDELYFLEGQYVRVEGVFKKFTNTNEPDLYVLAITDITKISKTGIIVYPVAVSGENGNIFTELLKLKKENEQ